MGLCPTSIGHKKDDMQCDKVTTLNQDLTHSTDSAGSPQEGVRDDYQSADDFADGVCKIGACAVLSGSTLRTMSAIC